VPPIISIQLKRFTLTSTEQNKILHFVEYPLLLNIMDFMSQYKKDPANFENKEKGIEGDETSGIYLMFDIFIYCTYIYI
jgi:hypothetical protein